MKKLVDNAYIGVIILTAFAIGVVLLWQWLQLIYVFLVLIGFSGLIGWLSFNALERSVKIAVIDRDSRKLDAKQSAFLTKDETVVPLPAGPYGYGVPNMLRLGNEYARQNTAALPEATVVDSQVLALPSGILRFSDLLERQMPTQDAIILGQLPSGQVLTTRAQELFHIALLGTTRGGKSNILRLLAAQLCYLGAKLYWLDLHWTDFDPKTGEDWRPIKAKLANPPYFEAADIARFIEWAVGELDARIEARRNQETPGVNMFMVLEELPGLVERRPDIVPKVAKLLREGAKFGLYLVVIAQDFLVKTIKADNGIRAMINTAYYNGGDIYSAAEVMKMERREVAQLEPQLGRGVALIRSSGSAAQVAKVPLADNDALYKLLGKGLDAPIAQPYQPYPQPGNNHDTTARYRVLPGEVAELKVKEVAGDPTDEDIFEGVYNQAVVSSMREAHRVLSAEDPRWTYHLTQQVYNKLIAEGRIFPKQKGPGRKSEL